jgi:hypothetical protein
MLQCAFRGADWYWYWYSHPADVCSGDHGNHPQDATAPLATRHSLSQVFLNLPSDQEWTAQTVLGHTLYFLTTDRFHSLLVALLPLQHVMVRFSTATLEQHMQMIFQFFMGLK